MFDLLRKLIIPVAIALFGLSQTMTLFVIAFGAVWPMLLSTVHGLAAVEPRLYEVARSLHLSGMAVIFKIGPRPRRARTSSPASASASPWR